ncbi:MAG: HDIG domain-containing protein [Candidatus Aureabacteria bacterium]|nr:HDIG domain-containing protein [Candidatus Auribacterota bacterium]NLW94075.1 HDIG domain-containing protein [Chlamydiota bacterium]HOE27614.1 HDIG domain-containing protein [bacterium]HQM51932.1 HDIG domain-containing protein [bacterium]
MKLLTWYRLRRQGVAGGRLRKKFRAGPLRTAFEKGPLVKTLIAAASFAGCVWIVSMGQAPSRETIDLFVGQPAPKDVFADSGFVYENREQTERLRREAAQKVLPFYSFSAVQLRECAQGLAESIRAADAARKNRTPVAKPPGAAVTEAEAGFDAHAVELLGTAAEPERIATQMEELLATFGGPEATIVADAARIAAAGGEAPERERHREALREAARAAAERWAAVVFPRDRRSRDAAVGLLYACCERSITYDETLTQRERDRAAERIAPVISRVQAGSKIIERGYEVTAGQMELYAAYLQSRAEAEPGPTKMRQQLYDILGLALLVVMLLILSRRYLMNYQPVLYDSNSSLLLLSLIMLGALLISRGISLIPFGAIQSSWNNLFHYFAAVSVPMAGILLTLLLSHTLALFFVALLALLVGIMKGFSLPYTLVSTVGGILAIYASLGVRRRSDLVRAGATVALGNIITIGALDAISDLNIVSATSGFRAAGGLVSGMLSAFLAGSVLPILEYAFNLATNFRLLELADLNHPLLKEMFIKAPGTYHHSLIVGTLAEAAAEAVGANPLQVRVGAYFHDIGKILKPEYYVENALFEESKHDELNPSMSNLIILSHVKDGVDIALTWKLNPMIVRAIQEHHGTGLVYFFYHRAEQKSRAEGEEVAQEDFRYPGPKPRSKETALILLADAVEAASRCLSRPTPGRIGNFVREIVYTRISDGQLDECDLTFNEVRLIIQRFEHVLTSTFHARVKYPTPGGGDDEDQGGEQGQGDPD